MTVVVFCGPSVTAEDARTALPGATCLGPAACGDIYRACRARPRAVVLCDGYFDHRLSVWHKEILWALSHGIGVYGAASMGALRAAELAPFGMIGVGRIFEQYRDGLLEDDDEVAVLHEAADRGYRPLSEALVNIRATLERAVSEAIVSADVAVRLIAAARRLFYPERTFETVLECAESAGVAAEDAQKLRRWLATHPSVNQKRLDAFTLLRQVRSDLADEAARSAPEFRFAYTDAWHALRTDLDREAAREREGASRPPAPAPPAELDAAPLDVPAEVWAAALERSLALLAAKHGAASFDAEDVQRQSERLRHARGLLTPEQTSSWLADNDLDLKAFSVLAYDELLVAHFRRQARALALAEIPNVLRLRGEYRRPSPSKKPTEG